MSLAGASCAGPILEAIPRIEALVIGDVMLDCFLFGSVERISPEAPVPVLRYQREAFMPGGAANVACNLASLGARASILGMIGTDSEGERLSGLLERRGVAPQGLLASEGYRTGTKTRIVAGQHQFVRVDREEFREPDRDQESRLKESLAKRLDSASAAIVSDYAKGMISESLLSFVKAACRRRGIWLSLDPKPGHQVDMERVSLLTPNRTEAFALAEIEEEPGPADPMRDARLLEAARILQERFQPRVLLITLGTMGMLLCARGQEPVHVPTLAREVFDVSGAGDTVIAAFTLAAAAGSGYAEAAAFANLAASVVVGKRGTATATPEEIRQLAAS